MCDLAVPKHINYETLEKVLGNKHKEENVKMKNFKVSMGSKKGDNYTSDIYRVHIDYELNGISKNTSVIVKYMIEREEAKRLMEDFDYKGCEKEMYLGVLPKYQELTGVKFGADCYYITEDKVVFFLEDLRSTGFEMVDRTLGLDLNQSKTVIKKLGKFHATSMVLGQQIPGIFDKFVEGIFRPTTNENNFPMKILQSSVELTLEVARKWEGFEKIVKKLEKILNNLEEKFLKCVQQLGRIKVLNHGDCWTNNLLFKYSENTKVPVDVIFVDYQIGFYSSMAIDFNYFFYSSPQQEVRDRFEEVLIDCYHKSLSESLMELKYSNIPSLDDVKEDIKIFQFFALFAATSVLPTALMERNEYMEYSIEGFGGTTSEFRRLQYHGRSFQEAIKKILLKFYRDGVLDYE